MLRWLFRPQCAACGVLAEDPLCRACAISLVELGDACERCAEPGPALCARCRREPLAVDRIVSPWRFGGALAIAIRRMKFAGAMHVARTVAPLWAPLLAAAVAQTDGMVVPVPLHWRRRLRRGFDQTWLLARHACALAGVAQPVHALRRLHAGPPQSTLPARERAANVDGGFAACIDLTGRAVILVDDVATTGATLGAAASALRDAGAVHVLGIALARAE
jgi:ComF family protein